MVFWFFLCTRGGGTEYAAEADRPRYGEQGKSLPCPILYFLNPAATKGYKLMNKERLPPTVRLIYN